MPESPIAPRPDVQRLVDENYKVSIEDNYLVIEDVPYVNADQQVARGALICAYSEQEVRVTGDHTVYFTGTVPHRDDGKSLVDVLVADTNELAAAGRKVLCRLSNKPEDPESVMANYYNKMTHYVGKLSRYAVALDSSVMVTSSGSFSRKLQPSVFHYPNLAIERSGLEAYYAKQNLKRVCIVGTGGTGSYILDGIAKTPIDEIHIYDGDMLKSHNVFRMPGTVSIEDAFSEAPKTEILASIYSRLRTGVVSHPHHITAENVHMLDGSDFVFIAVDKGPARGLIADHLASQGIPFIDVGIGVEKVPDITALNGRVRYTLVTPDTKEIVGSLPVADDSAEAVYNNIQLAELNALNAMLAVIRYKQHIGFYTDSEQVTSLRYVIAWNKTTLRVKEDAENQNAET